MYFIVLNIFNCIVYFKVLMLACLGCPSGGKLEYHSNPVHSSSVYCIYIHLSTKWEGVRLGWTGPVPPSWAAGHSRFVCWVIWPQGSGGGCPKRLQVCTLGSSDTATEGCCCTFSHLFGHLPGLSLCLGHWWMSPTHSQASLSANVVCSYKISLHLSLPLNFQTQKVSWPHLQPLYHFPFSFCHPAPLLLPGLLCCSCKA